MFSENGSSKVFIFYFEAGAHVTQAGHKLSVKLRIVLNFSSSCLQLPSAGMTACELFLFPLEWVTDTVISPSHPMWLWLECLPGMPVLSSSIPSTAKGMAPA